jgi:hypothetical protein
MRVRYIGNSTVRLFGAYSFVRGGQDTCEVAELSVIQEMMTQPGVEFTLAADDPLAQMVGISRAVEVVVFDGIMTPEEYRQAYDAPGVPDGKKFFREEVGEDDKMTG